MTWKKVINADPGDADHFGGNDIDKISDLFSGVADVDTVDINSQATFRSGKLKVRNPANTFSYTVSASAITANRTVFLPLLTADDTLVFQNAPQTLSNKTFAGFTLDPALNTFKGFAQDPLARRWGAYQPTASGTTNATVGTRTGMLSGHTPTGGGTASNSWDATEGLLINHVSSASSGSIAGLASPTVAGAMFRRSQGAMMRVKFKVSATTNTRFYFGVSSASTLPASDTPLATTDHGIIAGFATTDANFTARGNDGSGSATSYSLGTAKNTNFHTIEISWAASGSVKVIFNGATTTISTAGDLPTTGTSLFFHVQVQTVESVAKTLSLRGTWVECA